MRLSKDGQHCLGGVRSRWEASYGQIAQSMSKLTKYPGIAGNRRVTVLRVATELGIGTGSVETILARTVGNVGCLFRLRVEKADAQK